MSRFIDHAAEYPAFFGRQAAETLFPGIVKATGLSDLATRGEGPPYVRVRRKVVYARDDFLRWLDAEAAKVGIGVDVDTGE